MALTAIKPDIGPRPQLLVKSDVAVKAKPQLLVSRGFALTEMPSDIVSRGFALWLAMTKRTLPSLGAAATVSHAAPSVDEARTALGGRIEPALLRLTMKLGALAHFVDVRGNALEGVLVFATNEDADVWVGEGRLHRVPHARIRGTEAASHGHALADVAADALVFSTLAEGTRIRFVDRKGAMQAGLLAEKCRYGALVENEEKRILAISFRRIWPA